MRSPAERHQPAVLFVCTGNTCRSPMAAALLRSRLPGLAPSAIQSAGIDALPGEPASPEAVQAMSLRGIDLRAHRAQPVTAELISAFPIILVMTPTHRQRLLEHFPQAGGKVFLLGELGGQPESVSDPFGGGLENYQQTAAQLESLIDRDLHYIKLKVSD